MQLSVDHCQRGKHNMTESFAINFFLVAVASGLFVFLFCHGISALIRAYRSSTSSGENENKVAKFVMFPPTLDMFGADDIPEDPDEFN